jgi:hypothetical protein
MRRAAMGAEIRPADGTKAAAGRAMAPRRDGRPNRWEVNLMYLWRAVDHAGEILDMLVQRRRIPRQPCD